MSSRLTLLAAAAALTLAGCGGGSHDDGLSQEVAQGYAADGSTMPVAATGGGDSAVATLEAGVAAPTTLQTALSANADADAGAAPQADSSSSASCAAGGTVSWTVSGSDPTLLGNGRLDAGETYVATYSDCGTSDGLTLDGNLTVTVAQRSDTSLDVTLSSTGLEITNGLGRFDASGNWHHVRTTATVTGGTQRVSHITSTGVALETHIGSRDASYQLNTLDWTVTKTFDSTGALTTRSHSGTLSLDAHTPRRPNATLDVTTQGVLTLAADGLAASGSFRVVTDRNTIACTYGNGTATLTLDRGSDGSIDRTWTLTRTDLNGEAG